MSAGHEGWSSWDGASTTVTAVQYRRNGPWSGSVAVERTGHVHVHHGRIADMKRLARSLAVEHGLEQVGPDRWEASHREPDPSVRSRRDPGRPVALPVPGSGWGDPTAGAVPGWPPSPPVGSSS
jgi:hypothetical protein